RHRSGLKLPVDTTSRGWGLLLGHQRGPHLATTGDFFMAMDIVSGARRAGRTKSPGHARRTGRTKSPGHARRTGFAAPVVPAAPRVPATPVVPVPAAPHR
ncbi:MAG: hypothetical protein LCH98_13865, partial [Actinobacteria bacterium]|nr:hypothetical protein [Actinomycetota bacterium]